MMKFLLNCTLVIAIVLLGYAANGQVTAGFTVSQTSVCENTNIAFTNTSTGSVTCSWDFGDGDIRGGCNNQGKQYSTAGTYNVCLTATDNMGNSDVFCMMITILDAPETGFQVIVNQNCTPFTIELQDTANQNITGLWSWEWTIFSNNIYCDPIATDVITTTNVNPVTYTVQNAGTYSIQLEITNQLGCEVSLTKLNVFTAHPTPTAAFSANVMQDCDETTNVAFTNNSTTCTGNEVYIWDFGDGSDTSMAVNPTHEYASAATFPVTLIVVDQVTNCADTLVQNIVVPADETASFSVSSEEICLGGAVQFTDLTNGNTSGWMWDFGDGNNSNQANPSHTYAATGCYTVSLQVMIDSCLRTFTYPTCITVNALPTLNYFLLGTDFSCTVPHDAVLFSVFNTGAVDSVLWDFGDGNTTNTPDPTHTYTTRGTFPIVLTVIDSNSCVTSMSEDTITILNTDANFSAPVTSGCSPFSVQFQDNSVSDEPITNWNWTFQDVVSGKTYTSTDPAPSVVFDTTGTFSVTLIITNSAGCKDTTTIDDYVSVGTAPNIAFNMSANVSCINNPVQFTNQSQANASNFLWSFDFGNSTVDTTSEYSPSFTYTTGGTYIVHLSGETSGCASTFQDTITIEDVGIGFTSDTTAGCAPMTINFTDASTSASTVTWQWTFQDTVSGKTYTSSAQNPSIVFDTTGNYNVTLIIVNAAGCTDTLSRSEMIRIGTIPTLDFTVDDNTLCVNDSVSFAFTSIPASGLSNILWDFGNGATSTDPSPTYNYPNVGNYDVTFSAEVNGCADTLVKSAFITVEPPIASFNFGIDCADPLTVQFANTSTGGDTYLWDFDGEDTAQVENPTYTFSDTGTQVVTLTVSQGVCSNTYTEVINLNPPSSSYSFAPSLPTLANGCYPIETVFSIVNNSLNAASYEWILPNGAGFSSGGAGSETPGITFDSAGIFTIVLVSTADNGCADTTQQQVCIADVSPIGTIDTTGLTSGVGFGFTGGDGSFGNGTVIFTTDSGTVQIDSINGAPIDVANAQYVSGCLPLTVSFNDSSIAIQDTIASWIWYFGDGDTSHVQNPTHTYDSLLADGNAYAVILEVTTVGGNTKRDTLLTFVQTSEPTASFTVGLADPCTNENINFTNGSSGNGQLNYAWDFGDGNTSTDRNPTHAYSIYEDSSYLVTLTVTDENGCDTSYTDTVTVTNTIPMFVPDTTNGVCDPLAVKFTNTSTNISSDATWNWSFGNGSTSTLEQPDTVTYLFPGRYTVCLTAQRRNCADSTFCTTNLIDIDGPILDLSLTSMSQTATCIDTPNITFTAGGEAIMTYFWVTGMGDTIANQTGAVTDTIVIPYDTAGVFFPQLIVRDSFACDRLYEFGQLTIRDPIASFALDTTDGCVPLTVILDASASNDADSYAWTTPSAAVVSGASSAIRTIRYDAAGTYSDILLTVTDALTGCQDDTLVTLPIIASEVNAVFTMDTTTGCVPLTINFTDGSNTYEDSIVTYAWNFGEANTSMDTSSAQNPTYIYNTPSNNNTYTVTLTTVTAKGCTDTETQTVRPTFPTAGFTMSRDFVCTEQAINFTNQSTGFNNSFVWDFGNGDSSILTNPSYTYTAEGTYPICLTVTDANGCQQIFCDTAIVGNPVASFVSNPTTIFCPPDSIFFTESSTNAVAWDWTFGDFASSTEQNPFHVYQSPGFYDVSLIVTSSSGCQDTLTRSDYIEVRGPYAEFTYTPIDSCKDMTVLVCADSLKDVTLIFYESDDNNNTPFYTNPSQPFCFTYTYTERGIYFPSIEIQDTAGCPQDIAGPIIQVTDPEPLYTLSTDTACVPFSVLPNDASMDAQSYLWSVTGGTAFSITNTTATEPVISFSDTGSYMVHLEVTDRHGCKDTLSTPVVASDVFAAASASVNIGCRPLTVQFTDASSVYADYIASWNWDFGDGNTSTERSPTHIYTVNGNYTVTLTTTTGRGCTETITVDNITVTFPDVSWTNSLNEACTNQDITFSNFSSGENITQLWDFGNGYTSTAVDTTLSYPMEGTYNVCLTITDENNCDTTLCRTIVIADPVANFVVDATYIACPTLNQVSQFTDLSVSATAWAWDFGDGTTSTLQNPTHTYLTTGFYTVQLIVTNISGCQDTLVRTNYIEVDGPTGSFSFTPKSDCAPVTAQFTATANNAVLYHWYPNENPNVITQANASGSDALNYTYTTSGTFFPELHLEDPAGCILELTLDSIEVDTLNFDFSTNDTLECENGTFTFTPTINSSSPIDSVRWTFTGADVTTSSQNSPTITYSNIGTYDVMLTVYSRHCTKTVTKTNYIRIAPNPVTVFTLTPPVGCEPLTVNFGDATTISEGSIASWAWTLGDGNTSTSQNLTHLYDTCGTLGITLTTTSVEGCTNTASQDLVIHCQPTSAFTLPSLVCTGQTANFTNTSTGTGLTYSWNFGDGSTSTDTNTTHVYATEDTFNVCLTITDINGCTHVTCQDIIVADPVAKFSSDTRFKPCPVDSIQFIDQSINAVSWLWSFGDGETSTEQNPMHTFDTSGFYDITLIVTSGSGCQDTLFQSRYIEIGGAKGSFAFTPKSGCGDLSVRFEAAGYNVNTYIWALGNGDTVIHTTGLQTDVLDYVYTTAGEFYPTLRVEDTLGCGINITLDSVLVDTLQIDFYGSDTLYCDNGQATFTPYFYSNVPVDSVRWTFTGADISTSTSLNPMPNYSTVGEWDVTLTVYTRFCTKVLTKTNYMKVVDSPVAHFGVTPSLICDPNMAYFSDSSTVMNDNLVSWSWDFNDNGATSTMQNPAHLYQNAGLYNVALTVTSNYGCTNTTTIPVQINATPTSFFNSLTYVCTGQDLGISNQSTGNGLTYNWNFGDGNTSVMENPLHSYAAEGMYNLCVTVTDLNGCDSTFCQAITVANPVAEFTSDTQFKPCPPDSIQFTDQSINAVAWLWTFGDGQSSTDQNPMHTFDTSGFYDICLIVTSASGCQDTICKNQFIEIGGAKGNFTFSPKSGCGDLSVQFNATGYNVNTYIWALGNGDTVVHTTGLQTDVLNYVYTTAGEFYPTLRVEDTLGCGINITLDSVLVDTLQIDFYGSDTLYCDNGQATFTPYFYSNVPVDSVRWTFTGADISTSTSLNPMPNYSTVGEWDVTLTVYTRFCTKVLTKTNYMKVVDSPVAHFGSTPSLICDPNMAYFSDSSTVMNDNLVSWSWDFDDNGATSTMQNPAHLYQNAGLYNVALTVTSNYGCATTTTIPVEIDSTPTSFFTANTFACTNQDIGIVNLATGNGLTYNWNFGDGNTSIMQNPLFSYTAEGTYNICLTVTDLNGCDSTYCQSITVADPLAEFTADATYRPCPVDSIQFTDLSTNAVAWLWTFGDGESDTVQNPMHTFDTSGYYTICLIVTNASGCQDTICKNDYIHIGGAKGDFTVTPTAGCTPTDVTFVANAFPQGLGTYVYIWDFDDGVTQTHTLTSQIDSFTYTYDSMGVYIPKLRIQDAAGCGLDYIGDTITIDTLPIDFIATETFICGDGNTVFTPLITGGYTIDSVEWTFHNVQTGINTTMMPTVNYNTVGFYDVELKVYSGTCFYSIIKPNYIQVAPQPIASFATAPQPKCTDQAVTYSNTTQANGSNIVQWDWDYGDNTTYTVMHPPAHAYSTAGVYTATLIATTDLGCKDTVTQLVDVNLTPTPDAGIGATICLGDSITLNGTGGGTYAWTPANSLNDPTSPTPLATPTNTTLYTLSVTSNEGCINSDTVTIEVHPYSRPTLYLTPDTTICHGDVGQLFAQTNTSVTNVFWDQSSAGLSCYNGCNNPFVSPDVTTTYYVMIDGQGVCDTYDSVTVNVIDPNSNIIGDDVAICSDDSIQLNISMGDNPVWSPAEGLTCVFCPDPIASPDVTTDYVVTVDLGNCVITDTVRVEVVQLAEFSAGPDSIICPNDVIELGATSPVTGIYQWTPTANVTNPTSLVPTVSPDSTTLYTLNMTYGLCSVSDSVLITVEGQTNLVVPSEVEICYGEEALIDVFTNADSVVWSPTDGILMTDPIIVSPEETTVYTLNAFRNNCTSVTTEVTVTVNPLPEINTLSFITSIQGLPTTLSVVNPRPDYIYEWSPDRDITCTVCPEAIVSPDTTTTYYISATTPFGCVTTDSVLITVEDTTFSCGDDLILMPNTFTPNNDGFNDVFFVRGNGIRQIASFRVFNRWGELVFETSEITEGWDGTYRNQPAVSDIYLYHVIGICPTTGETVQKKGDILLLR